MKIKIVILFLICLAFSKIKAQTLTPAPNANLIYTNIFAEKIKIGGGTSAITSSAILEANSTNKGILLPRMTNAQMLAIVNPVRGLIVYNTDNNCLYVRNTTTWVNTCANLSVVEINWNSVTNKPTTIAGYGITDYNSLFDTRLSSKTTTDIVEGTNLYWTTTRGDARYLPISNPTATGTITSPKFTVTGAGYIYNGNDVSFGGGNTNDFVIYNNSGRIMQSTAGNVRFTITNAGNVGIGTLAPTEKFELSGGNGKFTNNVYLASFSSTYKVGVGNTSPSEKLDVTGNIKGYHIIGQNNIYDSTVVSGVKKIIKGDDLGGSLLLGTSSTRLTGDILTVTFSNAYLIPPYIVISDANDNYASGLTNVVKVTTTTTGFKLTVKTGLSLETDEVYKWNYYIKQ